MRVSTAFNRMLAIPGAWVAGVTFAPDGVVVELRRRFRRLTCPSCGWSTRARYDGSVRRWRHLDLGSNRLFVEAEIRRLECRSCGKTVTEQVPWARHGARHTRDFEDVVAWLTQRTDKTSVSRLMRCSWEAVDGIVQRVVADHIDDARLDDLYRIGVDEISYRRGHHYLTVVANHDDGTVVWIAKDRTAKALTSFYEALGPERREQIQAVSMDLGAAYRKATRDAVPHAQICVDPFHIIQMANRALDTVYTNTARELGLRGRDWHRTRAALRRGAERLTPNQRTAINRIRRLRSALWRAWEMKEDLRDLYRITDPADAKQALGRWLQRASRSRIRPFVLLAQTVREHFDGIAAAVELGLSNSRLEGINARIRLIHRRGYGYRTPTALTAMIYLCCGGVTVQLPTER